MGRQLLAVFVLSALVLAACGGGADEAAVDTTPETSTTTSSVPTTAPATAPPTTSTAPTTLGAPAVAALSSGRGDDGSLEVGVWFSSDPFEAGDVRLIVGTDSDGSFPGVGDPVPHIDGWAEVTEGDITILEGGTPVADDATVNEWLSWTGPGHVVWVYFIQTVPVRAGTVWVVLEFDGEAGTGGVAGAPFGEGCSFHSAGVDLGQVPGDVPDFGTPCRYPLG